jgi:hypothetical protein
MATREIRPIDQPAVTMLRTFLPDRSHVAAIGFAALYVIGVTVLITQVLTGADATDTTSFFGREKLWIWLTVLVPSLLVLQQGLYLGLFRPPPFSQSDSGAALQGAVKQQQTPETATPGDNSAEAASGTGVSGSPGSQDQPGQQPLSETAPSSGQAVDKGTGAGTTGSVPTPLKQQFPETAELIDKAVGEAYGAGALFLDYFLPTLLNVVCGAILAYLVCQPPDCCGPLPPGVADGVRFGGLGALVYVLMTLSQRTFLRDVTRGAAVWSAVQMLLGPLLGGIAAVIVSEQAQFTDLTRQAIYFFAGLAPRPIVSFVQETVGRFFGGDRDAPHRKLLPLASIRGITPQIEDRLMEEGITDGHMLAMANPIRLARDMPFEERQILAWIDEAFLLAVLGEQALAVQKQGITGAIDLAYCHIMYGDKRSAKVKELARRIQMDEEALSDILQRLYEDDQVKTIWMLYQGPNFH